MPAGQDEDHMIRSDKEICIAILVLCCFLLLAARVYSFDGIHLDRSVLPEGCSSCHKGHGKRATVMLDRPKDELCFKCHGPSRRGVRGEAATDIYSVVLKRSNHPVVQTSRYHVPGEILPERSPSTPRHVSCYDCHNVHLLTKEQTFRGVRGYSGRGAAVREVRKEHEVCYQCHADSSNLPLNTSNIARKFDPGNASYHPIEAVGKNRSVPSLKTNYSTSSLINCSDCHGNDDRTGPKGPHGSIYEGLLKANYARESGPESSRAYELCYECHNRNSILNDESFKAHRRHILFGNTSCFACHDSHGSRDFDNLINFDRRVVFSNTAGQLNYLKSAPGRPRCFLSCHVGAANFDHKLTGGQYCINTSCPPGW